MTKINEKEAGIGPYFIRMWVGEMGGGQKTGALFGQFDFGQRTLAKMIDRIFQEMSPSVNPNSNAFSEVWLKPILSIQDLVNRGPTVKWCSYIEQ